MKSFVNLFLLLLLMSPTFFSCRNGKAGHKETFAVDLPQIKERGKLVAVTLNSSTSYFIYKTQPMGYEYELIEDFAKSLGLLLEIKVAENVTRLESMLQEGDVDIVAYPIQMDNAMKQKVLFCGQEQQNHLVLVQPSSRKDTVLKDVSQLIGKEVYVKHGSRYHERLLRLNAELGGGIIIKDIERDTVTTEDLIEMVSLGKIKYTVSENNLARLNKTYYKNININMPISFPQRTSWIVRKSSPELAAAVNDWALNVSKKQVFIGVVKRYFEQSKDEDDEITIAIRKGDISPYDDLFKKYAKEVGWDWRLLASIAYQESKFHTNLESWAGARGLMGIMPRTARALGFSSDSLDNPEISIQIGVKCLIRFRNTFKEITDPEELMKFTLAAYNTGNGHIADVRKLAEKYGSDPNVWSESVEDFLRKKSEPKYYNDPVCKHGYLRGTQTYNYVREVMARYKNYKAKTEKNN